MGCLQIGAWLKRASCTSPCLLWRPQRVSDLCCMWLSCIISITGSSPGHLDPTLPSEDQQSPQSAWKCSHGLWGSFHAFGKDYDVSVYFLRPDCIFQENHNFQILQYLQCSIMLKLGKVLFLRKLLFFGEEHLFC